MGGPPWPGMLAFAMLFAALCGVPACAQSVPRGPSLTTNATVVLTSNSLASTRAAIIDGNDTTAWQSDADFPTGYVQRKVRCAPQ